MRLLPRLRKHLASPLSLLAVLALGCPTASRAQPASFVFGSGGIRNTVNGLASADLTDGGFQLTIEAGPSGAVLNDGDGDGLGVNTSAIPGVVDGASVGDTTKLNVIDGTAPVSGDGESLTLSFDRSGVLTGLLFDGLKDETLEYYTIEFPNASIVTFFDFETGDKLADQGFTLGDLGVPNPVLADDRDDDLVGIGVPFNAGDEFRVTYGEIDFANVLPGYQPVTGGFGNGARFEGVTVIPEPASLLSAVSLLLCGLRRRSR